ncbi:MAG: PAS domain S-box protein [Candidatus Hydrogenedentes bacterium]|nr:PAS domain S-box protein [Candidatus Hydrogenedentota bacterium]
MSTLAAHNSFARISGTHSDSAVAIGKSRSGMGVFGVLFIAFVIEVFAHILKGVWPGHNIIVGLITTLGICVVLAPGVYLVARIRGARSLKRMMLASTFFLIGSQGLGVTDDISAINSWPILGDAGAFHDTARWVGVVLGMLLLLSSLYFALLETITAESRLLHEQQGLVAEAVHRRHLADALIEQDNVYRAAITQAGAIPYRINWATKSYTFYDDHIYRLTGFTPDELTFDRLQSLPDETRYVGPLAGTPVDEIGRLIAGGAVRNWQREYRIRTRLGDEKWINDNSVEVVGSDGLITETIGLMQDITDRKREEEVLSRNERYFRALTENAQDLITVLNFDGTIRYESPSITGILGYQPNELTGRNVFELVHPDDRVRILKTFTEALRSPELSRSMRFRCMHKNGTWKTLESVGRSMMSDPDIEGAVINSRDITERETLEQQLLHSQKMEGIGRLAGGVAHDFNNLLTAIMGYCDFALESIPEGSKVRGQIEQVTHAAQRAAELTRQLLAFARKQIVEPRNTNLNTLTLNLEKLLRRLIGEDIDLVTFPSADPAIVCIDPGQFEQVVVNLAVNARDAMLDGGKLTLEIEHVVLDDDYAKYHPDVTPGDYVMLAMSDTGMGMPEEIRRHIFEPFFTTKEDGKGTGLGLATCYGIVKQVGGHIWVYSEPGNGTTFKIYLPRVSGEAANITRAPARPAAGGNETILLVEDEPMVRAITCQTLIERGYTVLEASDGQSALGLAANYHGAIDLLLTDVVMPKISGRELAEQLRMKHRDLKVLYMSGYTEDAIVHHGVLEQGISFLPKPFAPEALARKVRFVLDAATKTPALARL